MSFVMLCYRNRNPIDYVVFSSDDETKNILSFTIPVHFIP
jgi:hypothetical protein